MVAGSSRWWRSFITPAARHSSSRTCRKESAPARIAPEAIIYILNGLPPGTGPVFAEHYLQPVIGSTSELAEWDTFCSSSGWHGGFALHVDTGMNRLGVTIEEAAAIAPRLSSENHGMTLLMSHLISAETPDNARNHEQMLGFREIRRLFRGIPASLCQFVGHLSRPAALCDLVRPGVALFGLNPTPGKPNPMRRVVELKARDRASSAGSRSARPSAITRPGPRGGRRASRSSASAMRTDIFAPRAATTTSRAAHVLVGGAKCPIVGRISMDLTAIDVTDLPANAAKRGDFVTLIGEGLELEEVAEQAGTIGYEVLTNFGHRYARIYKSEDSAS